MMRVSENFWRTALALSVPLFVFMGTATAGEPETLRDKAWTWGYVIEKTPGEVPFVTGKSTCSLETGAAMMGTPNVIYLNSNHNKATMSTNFLDRIASSRRIICALQHGDYAGTARKVSAMSKKYPNIVGGLIDDFMDYHGPSKNITPEETKAVYDALKSENPALKLYVVRYTWQDQKDLIPYLPYFDVINLWVWKGEEKPWRETLEPEIDHIREITRKPILLGQFMHDYGATGKAMAMNVLELQTKKAVEMTKSGKIEGFVLLQSGWFHHEDHQPQVQWLKNYLSGVFGTAAAKP